jgi:hypothetical protein
MWMAGFRYLLASTQTVQKIMQMNNDRLEQKMKIVTERIQKKKIRYNSLIDSKRATPK